ncbi:hypothetical protein P8631_12515, partial [Guyparkeria sp. 1SP6A2]|nr:hypothetical protein [Guyparkeria sp. 1SP6A2]
RAEALSRLGLNVATFLDNDDDSVNECIASAEASGVKVIRWNPGLNTESQVCADLKANGLTSFIKLGVERRSGEDTVLQDLNSIEPTNPVPSLDVEDWTLSGIALEDARDRIVTAAVKHKWFKNVDGGRALGEWIVRNYTKKQLASTVALLEQVKAFVYSEKLGPGKDTSGERADG